MQAEKLKQIQENIRKNWGKVKPFKRIPKKHFNCYMFAVCCTVPTEILTCTGTCISTINENVTYFGSIGQFSGSKYETREQYKEAWFLRLSSLKNRNSIVIIAERAEKCNRIRLFQKKDWTFSCGFCIMIETFPPAFAPDGSV